MPDFLPLPDGRKIAYAQRKGASPGIMFFSGFKSDMEGMKALHLDALCAARGQTFLRFDYTGHGKSSGAFERGTIGAWLQDALDIFDALAPGPQILVGSSMGAWIALLLALKRRERIAGIITLAAAPDFTETLVWEKFPDAQKKQLMEEGRVLIPDCYGAEPYPITRTLVEEGRNHLLLGAPVPLNCPVRLLHGTADEDVPWQTSAQLMERLKSADARLTLIKGSDHRLSGPKELQMLTAAVEQLLQS